MSFDTRPSLRYNALRGALAEPVGEQAVPRPIVLVILFCLAVLLANARGWCEEEEAPQPEQENAEADQREVIRLDNDEENGDDEKLTPEQELGKAANELEAGRIGEAYAILSRLAGQEEDEDTAARARERLKQIEADGGQKVKEALAIDDPQLAEEKLNEIYRDYRQTSVKHLLAEAQKQLQVRRALRALADAGAEEVDEEATEEDKAARMWLIIGNIHRLNDRQQQAIEAYNVLVYEYPESRFTQQARDWLQRLRPDEDARAAKDEGDKE